MKKYKIIYADPPWKLDISQNRPEWGDATYNTMTTDEICKLPIEKLADKDCVLFMWVTMPFIEDSMEVIKSWGFKYITCAFVWVKTNPKSKTVFSGLGKWVNGNAELCFLAKRGHPKRIEKNIKQIQVHPRRKHSKKPDFIRNEIVRLMGDLSRIELFARERMEGWDCFGDETPTSEQKLLVSTNRDGNKSNK